MINNKKILLGLITVLLLILLSFLVIWGYSDLSKKVKLHSAQNIDIIDQRMRSLFLEINSFPRLIGDDLLFLSKLYSLKNVINRPEAESRVIAIKNLEQDLLAFMKGSTAYYQLIYMDEKGHEIAKIKYDDDQYQTLSREKLQAAKKTDRFNIVSKLAEGEVFISRLELNTINGELENRGTEQDPTYVPIMRYSTPVFNENKEFRGLILLTIYLDYFLEDIRRFQREGEIVVLINKEGDYLAHPAKEKEFALITGGSDNFYKDYPQIGQVMLSDLRKDRIESDDLIFSFKYIHPTSGNFALMSGLKI